MNRQLKTKKSSKLKELFLCTYLSQSVHWLGWALSMLVCGIFAAPKDAWSYFGLSFTGIALSVGITTLGNRLKKNEH